MKHFTPSIFCMLLLAATPAQALDSRSCDARSAGLGEKERIAFLHTCLAEASSPAHVKELALQQKHLNCEQNAKNRALQGDEKASYIQTCMHKDEAREVLATHAPAIPAPSAPSPAAPIVDAGSQHASPSSEKAAPPVRKPAKRKTSSCEQQAKQQGLKGDAFNKFMSKCKKASGSPTQKKPATNRSGNTVPTR